MNKPTIQEVAIVTIVQMLLGKKLITEMDAKQMVLRITEAEKWVSTSEDDCRKFFLMMAAVADKEFATKLAAEFDLKLH